MKVTIIYPCDFFHKRSVENDYKAEFIEASKFKFNIVFFDHDEFVSSNNLKFYSGELEEGMCIYRGWMLKPEQYGKLYDYLKDKKLNLINNPEQYSICHEFPNSYSMLETITPPILTFPKDFAIDWESVKGKFEKFMMKDFVKSVKGSEFPQYFDRSYSNIELDGYLKKFIALRGDLYTGGIVLKKYMPLAKNLGNTNEYRAFYLNGVLISLFKNSNQQDSSNRVPITFIDSVPKLKSNFYTVDLAELENGDWIVIEVGDGQVSGLPSNQDIYKFYEKIDCVLNH